MGTLEIKPLCQTDPRWANILLGTSTETISEGGCLLTCITMLHNSFGGNLTPAEMNQCLIAVGGYFEGNLFIWNSLAKVSRLALQTLKAYEGDASKAEIIAALEEFRPVIAHIDSRLDMDGIQNHYVVLLDRGWHGTRFTYADPLDGSITKCIVPERVLHYAIYAGNPYYT